MHLTSSLFLGLFLGQLPTAPEPDMDITKLSAAMYEGFVAGNWWVVGFAALILAVFVLRTYGGRWIPALKPALDHPVVAWATPALVSSLTAVLMALLAGKPIVPALKAGLGVAFAAVWAFVGYKKVLEARELAAEKAAAVPDKAAALTVHEKGPQP